MGIETILEVRENSNKYLCKINKCKFYSSNMIEQEVRNTFNNKFNRMNDKMNSNALLWRQVFEEIRTTSRKNHIEVIRGGGKTCNILSLYRVNMVNMIQEYLCNMLLKAYALENLDIAYSDRGQMLDKYKTVLGASIMYMAAPKKTHEQYVSEVKALVGTEYTVLSKYINATEKIRMRHNTCGYEYEVIPSAFISKGNRCPRCAQKLKGRSIKDSKTFLNEVYSKIGNEYDILSEYKGSKEKIRIRHNKCGHIWEVYPHLFLAGTRCPICAKKNITKTTQDYKEEVFKLHKEEYSVLGEYINAQSKILVRHNKCGYEWYVRAQSLLGQTRCPKCFGRIKKTQAEFEEEVRQLGKGEYEVIGKYINNRTKIKIRHKICGQIYEVLPSAFLQGKRCPNCAHHKKNHD